ncbi:MAG TPA: hypothetical protein VNA04_17455 [Thermoanaerobaculia bacterium]|nr:hypothetical protein [Thermoanaerobaculia bacterium]
MNSLSPTLPPVVIASFRSPAEAQAARAAVEEAGMRAWLVDERSLRSEWRHPDALAGVGLVVAPADVERALAVLEGLWPEQHAVEEVAEPERCPECRSPGILRLRSLPFFVVFAAVMLTAGYLVGQRDLFTLLVVIVAGLLVLGPNRRCTSCGARWRSWSGEPRPPDTPPVEPPEVPCPRCGSTETGTIDRRPMKAWTLLVNFVLPPLLLIWPFLPRRRCEECGMEWR